MKYSKKELARELKVSPRTIVNWTRLEKDPLPFKIRHIYSGNVKVWEYTFYHSEVVEWLNSRTAKKS